MSLTGSAPVNKATSFNIVREEVIESLGQAEAALERFLENRESAADMQLCIDQFSALKGVFDIIELEGAKILCEEILEVANEVPVGAGDEKDSVLTVMGKGIFSLSRYLEFINTRQKDLPELLIPVVNELRQQRKLALIPDSHYFMVNLKQERPAKGVACADETQVAEVSKRYRHMYMVGLLGIMKGEHIPLCMRLMVRSMDGLEQLCGDKPVSKLWWLMAAALEGLIDLSPTEVADGRKRLFMQIERYIRKLNVSPTHCIEVEPPIGMVKDLLYINALVKGQSERCQQVLDIYSLANFPDHEIDRQHQIALLMGPGSSVLASVSAALCDELNHVKDQIDLSSRVLTQEPEDLKDIIGALRKILSTLVLLNLDQEAKQVHHQVERFESWLAEGKKTEHDDLMQTADALLAVEDSIRNLEGTLVNQADNTVGAHNILTHELDQAQINVLKEADSGLSITKRALNDFVESDWDKMHLTNIVPTLASVRGGFLFLEKERAAKVVDICSRYIDNSIIRLDTAPRESELNAIADVLSSLEYYLEGMLTSSGGFGEQVLDLADEALKQLGCRVD
ncbi:hypothetical protein [Litoribrevibacter albus]|uniref:Scaffold protein FimL second domain-containing protein n=1 Tax=Litoribrevibacter albus TaxID=1473156 RepID=A0AA37SCY7_9GAMM|nr:hypothetical protein [Litoribrevibacter albus]GLQ32254.1 hypothetical protein GCM10007876_27330 [Litoribrevibacter albus]